MAETAQNLDLNLQYYLSLSRNELPRHSISNISIKLNNYLSVREMNALILNPKKKKRKNKVQAQQKKYRYPQCIIYRHLK